MDDANTPVNPKRDDLIDGKYSIRDLLDLEKLRGVFQKFTDATGFTIGFLDHPAMNILIATGWRDICTKFHRAHPASAAHCTTSNRRLLDGLTEPGRVTCEACENGLVDCAMPVIIKGKHVASLATGQLLLAEPDITRFRDQAKRYGYDERNYLAALKEIPVVPEEKLMKVTAFLGDIAALVSGMGYATLLVKEEAAVLEKQIAERRKASQALCASEERYRRLIETALDVIVLIDLRGTVIAANLTALRLYGYEKKEEVIGRSIMDFVVPDDRARALGDVRKVLDTITLRDLTYRCVMKDGSSFPAEINASVMLDAENKPSSIVLVIRDITTRRKAEEELEKYREHLEDLVKLRSEELLKAQKELEQDKSLAAIGGLAAAVAHRLRTPLGTIRLSIFNMKTKLKDPSLDFHFSNIDKKIVESEQVIRNLLFYASHLGKPYYKPLNIHGILDESIREVAAEFTAANVAVNRRYGFPADTQIEADAMQLKELFRNILTNAYQALGEKEGVIEVATEAGDGEKIRISVKDNGTGIPSKDMIRMRQPFFTTKSTGMGLGLSVSSIIARLHDGAIDITSDMGQGTTVTVVLPLTQK